MATSPIRLLSRETDFAHRPNRSASSATPDAHRLPADVPGVGDGNHALRAHCFDEIAGQDPRPAFPRSAQQPEDRAIGEPYNLDSAADGAAARRQELSAD
jgi:hypothetical protein